MVSRSSDTPIAESGQGQLQNLGITFRETIFLCPKRQTSFNNNIYEAVRFISILGLVLRSEQGDLESPEAPLGPVHWI